MRNNKYHYHLQILKSNLIKARKEYQTVKKRRPDDEVSLTGIQIHIENIMQEIAMFSFLDNYVRKSNKY